METNECRVPSVTAVVTQNALDKYMRSLESLSAVSAGFQMKIKGRGQNAYPCSSRVAFSFLSVGQFCPTDPQIRLEVATGKKKDRLSYCPIYKAGSSTWLYNLIALAGVNEAKRKNSEKEQLSTVARRLYPELDYERAKAILENSAKLMVVRHPFERLLSAYRDKLENINSGLEHGTRHFYKKYGAKIVKKFRSSRVSEHAHFNEPGKPAPSGLEPTFPEFVKYLISTDLLNHADDHWISYNMFCTPCLVDYDYIGKTETLNRDQMFLIEREGLSRKIAPRWRHRTRPVNATLEDISKFYFSQLTKSDLSDLYEKYKLDFEMFEYDPSLYLKYTKD